MIRSRRISQNPSGLRAITTFNFADINKIFANTIIVIYFVINNENPLMSAPLLELLNIAKYR